MKLYGLQKMTLLDFPGRVACTVFTGGCQFRCPYCHNFELAEQTAPVLMDSEELFSFLEKRRGLLDGVAVTGGEPTLNPDLPDFLRRVRSAGFATKLDTNGMNPSMLKTILEEGLADYIAMDIKNSPGKYAATVGLPEVNLEPIRESVRLLLEGKTDYEFRTTVVEEFHEAADFEEIACWIAGARRYFLQCFTDRDTVPFGNLHAPTKEALESYARILLPHVPETHLRGVD